MNKSYLVICIVGLVYASSAIGDTLNVPSAAYPTIQSAINTAENGDTVLVAAGTYTENLVWETKSIALVVAGAGVTIVDGGGNGSCLVMRNVPDTASVEGFTFTGGAADNGGALYLVNSSPTLTNCTFSGNSAKYYGGGIYNTSGSPMLTNCTFSSNSAIEGFGGGMYNKDSSPTLTNCTFGANSAKNMGGGMFNRTSRPTLTNCTFRDNSAENHGGGMYNYISSSTVTDCTFTGNLAKNDGGGMSNTDSSPTLTNCTFSENLANYGGGGLRNCRSSPRLTNCIFSGNYASMLGGGVYNWVNSSPTLTNCTFSGNSADIYGGGMSNSGSIPTLTNCILWGDSAANGPEIRNDGTSSLTVSYSDVKGGWPGDGNISADPMFVGAGDYHLQNGSPCIDAGSNSAPELPETDKDGNPRIVNGIVDMGAFEAPPSCTPVSIDSLTADPLVVPLGSAVNFEATITDGCKPVDALWDFDDGTVDPQSNVTSPVTTTKTYASAGIYTVVLTVSDDRVDVGDNIIVVVYNPTGGFVTGGGWIISPEGAYALDPSLTGKANFGFVSKYKKGTTVPTGNTEFLFKAGNLNFHSSSYDWLLVTGSNYAKFKGKGTINGSGENHFMLWAGDTPDTFRIKIWTENDGGSENVVYDNGFDQIIDGGSIVIHTK